METEKEYQLREWRSFINQKYQYFDTVKEFDESLGNMDILEQIEWIESGSYGAGACLELQRVLSLLTKRNNSIAHIGNVVLHAFYGKPFRYWNKLSQQNKDRMNEAVKTWLKQEHSFAIEFKF